MGIDFFSFYVGVAKVCENRVWEKKRENLKIFALEKNVVLHLITTKNDGIQAFNIGQGYE